MKYLLDTGVVGAFVDHRDPVFTRVRAAVIAGNRVGTAVPVVGELFAGVELSATRATNLPRLVHALHDLVAWPFDRRAAEEYGRLFAVLRRKGRPMQQIDIQVAAIALTLGDCAVVTLDSDFQAIPGLSVEDWSV